MLDFKPKVYIAYDKDKVIWGLGFAGWEAMADGRAFLAEANKSHVALHICECTEELANLVHDEGGDIPKAWEIKEGIATIKVEYQVAMDL